MQDFKSLIKDVFSFNPGKACLTLILVILVGITNGVSIVVLIPLIQVTGFGELKDTDDYLSKLITRFFDFIGIHPSLGGVLLIFFLVFLSMALLQYQQIKSSTSLANKFSAYKREGLYKQIFNSQWSFFFKNKMAHTASILTVEAQRVMLACDSLFRLTSESFLTMSYIVLALILSWQVTVIVVFAGAAISWFMRKQIHSGRRIGKNITEYNNNLQSAVWEHLGSAKVIKSYSAEKQSSELFQKLVYKVSELYILFLTSQARIKAVFEPITVAILCIGLYVALTFFNINTANLIVLLLIFYRLFPKISSVQQYYHKFLAAISAYTAICSLEKIASSSHEYFNGKKEVTSFSEGITLENVSFSYHPENGDTLSDINISIPYGKTIALVGESGAGKSTIADLILGLLLPAKGALYVDKEDISNIDLKSWRSHIGYVTQDTLLFHDSILSNLLWVNPEASESDISRALRIASADEFVKNLSEGINTIIGDRGVRLSGGQRQRLALARALLRNPGLLILDEATSSLDAESEKRIQEAIESLQGSLTILIITHRLATVRNADFIYTMSEGKIVESGSWDDLTEDTSGYFYSLCGLQGLVEQ